MTDETMSALNDTLSDWTVIDTTARLRGCLHHVARLLRRGGDTSDLPDRVDDTARSFRGCRLNGAERNGVLYSLCIRLGIL